MKLLKALILTSLLAAVSLNAETITYNGSSSATTANIGSQTNYGLLTNGFQLVSVTIVNNNPTTNLYVKFFDSPTNVTWTNAAFISVTSGVSSVVTTWTNFLGATNSITNTMWVSSTNTTAAATNNYYTMFQTTVGSNGSTVIYAPQGGQLFTRGLTFTNNAAGTNYSITVNYQLIQ